MATLSEQVLPLIRTRADLHRYSRANEHGDHMHDAIDILEAARTQVDAKDFYQVTHKALASAISVIARADDSAGIIGDACRRLLRLHPIAAAPANIAPAKLVDWIWKFHLEGEVDYFELDPVAYATALGKPGIALYRERLEELRVASGEPLSGLERYRSPHYRAWVFITWSDQRLAVLDRDVDAIIRLYGRDLKVAAWYENVARAMQEISEWELAEAWARKAVDFGFGHQSEAAASRWCALVEHNRPEGLLEAHLYVFNRWPNSGTATKVYHAAGESWHDAQDEVENTLRGFPGTRWSLRLKRGRMPCRLGASLTSSISPTQTCGWRSSRSTSGSIPSQCFRSIGN